jgi:hypothetical protein
LERGAGLWAVFEKAKDITLKPEYMGCLLRELLDHDVVEARIFAESLVTPPIPAYGEGRTRAIIVARMLMTHTEDAGWAVVWPAMQQDVAFGREVVAEVAGRAALGLFGNRAKIAENSLADLYILLVHQYPPAEDLQYKSGEAHIVGSRESIAQWRDALLQHLKALGTQQACEAIRRIMEEFPHEDWLKWTLLDAQNLVHRRTWVPPQPESILKMARNPQGRLVQSGDQLLDVLIESLKRLEAKLQRETPAAIDLWNEIKAKDRTIFNPKDEERFSDYVKRCLEDNLGPRGIILNREVEIRRGQYTDLRVDAL